MKQIIEQFEEMAACAIQGEVDPLETFCQLKSVADKLKDCIDAIKEPAYIEAVKHSDKKFGYKGYNVTPVKGKASYSYDHIVEWVALKADIDQVQNNAKTALKMAQDGKSMIDTDGCLVEPAAVKYGKDSLTVKIAE